MEVEFLLNVLALLLAGIVQCILFIVILIRFLAGWSYLVCLDILHFAFGVIFKHSEKHMHESEYCQEKVLCLCIWVVGLQSKFC